MSLDSHATPTESVPSGGAAPPHPFRVAPWYDPRVTARPVAEPLISSRWRIGLVIFGGVLLPIISVVVNAQLSVVDLGVFGVGLCLASVLSVVGNLVWVRRKVRPRAKQVSIVAPASNKALIALLASSLLSLLWWAYLAVLFFPIFPLSVIAVVFMGIGFCGLCPFFVTGICATQSLRLIRLLKSRRRGRTALLIVFGTPLLALALTLAGALVYGHQRDSLAAAISALVQLPGYSEARMAAIAELSGREQELVQAALREHEYARRQAMAEAYERLRDEPIASAMAQQRPRRRRAYAIRPFFFAQGESPLGFRLMDPFANFLRF